MDSTLIKKVKLLSGHPKFFMKYCCYTKDGNDPANPIKKFPYHIPYHQALIETFHSERLVAIIKSRQMQITWSTLGYILWYSMFHTDQEIYVRRQTFEDAQKLLDDLYFIYEHIPLDIFPEEIYPKAKPTEGMIYFPELNNQIIAVCSGKDRMRGRTPSVVVLDEFAFQDDDAMVFSTLKPSLQGGAKVILISTPKPLFGGEDPYFRRVIEDRV